MINQNIKRFRKAKGLSQEEMAVKLNVVRQTVSKWENGLSVPDADVLLDIAQLLDVSVEQLLGIAPDNKNENLAEELAKLNEQLAEKNKMEKRLLLAGRKRGLILFFSFLAMIIAVGVKNEPVSILLVGACMLAATIVLYRNLALLTSVTTDDLQIGILRVTTLFNMVILIIGIVVSFLIVRGVITFSENEEKIFAMIFLSCVMILMGVVSPKLPYNRHIGLRLPWTVQDEDTWKLAHRILGYISLPIVLFYIACVWIIPNFEVVSTCAMLVWIGIPGGISYIYFYKKYHVRLK